MDLEETLGEVHEALGGVPKIWQEAPPGRQLRALRRARRVSQRHLADASGVDQADISRIERGADARLSTWKTLFLTLGYDAVLLPLFPAKTRRIGWKSGPWSERSGWRPGWRAADSERTLVSLQPDEFLP
ncbi:MAG: helix-turn-helix domain-containing protein [Elusimicrobiota bacterium]